MMYYKMSNQDFKINISHCIVMVTFHSSMYASTVYISYNCSWKLTAPNLTCTYPQERKLLASSSLNVGAHLNCS